MSQICTTVIDQVLVPGTGGFFPVPDQNWRATARSRSARVSRNAPWRYSFRPVRGSVFVTGLYDDNISSRPELATYLIAVEFQQNGFYVRHAGQRSSRIAYGPGNRRIAILRTNQGQYIVLLGDNEVWRSA